MADASPLCFSTFSHSPFSSLLPSKDSSSLVSIRRSLFSRSHPSTRIARIRVKSPHSGGFLGGDPFGPFPWQASEPDDAIQWVPEERVTLFTTDGLVQIGGFMVPRRSSSLDKKEGKSKRLQRFQESDYMDPNQGLCLGALFDIAATNGLDSGRRLCILGFCRSIEMLSDVVEDTVLEHGGEIVAAKKASKGGLHEKLTMKVAVPLLWGVPPASETLHRAVRSGGGIVDKVYWQWDFL